MSSKVLDRRGVKSHRPGQAVRPSAVAWINDRGATVARIDGDGSISTQSVDRALQPEALFLDFVVRAIGDRERVLIVGPDPARLALEREYVAIYQRPDRLIDVEPAGAVDPAGLVDRVRELAD